MAQEVATTEKDLVFTVRATNDEVDPEARWGIRMQLGFQAGCSVCGESEIGTSGEIGELIRGHITWHSRHIDR
jgi:hypothetical protein